MEVLTVFPSNLPSASTTPPAAASARIVLGESDDMAMAIRRIETALGGVGNASGVVVMAGDGAMPMCVAVVNVLVESSAAVVQKVNTRSIELSSGRGQAPQMQPELQFTLMPGQRIADEIERRKSAASTSKPNR